MRLYDHSFRDLYHQFILLPIDKNDPHIPEFFAEFPHYDEANALLLYGYIDHEAGMTFEVLSAAIYENETETTTLFPGNDEITVKLRSESIGDQEIVLLNQLAPIDFDEKIDILKTHYKADKGVELCRRIKELDPYRHADYPDDIIVVFYDEEKGPEFCWVRCENCQVPRFIGTLLNEPKNMSGIHRGDKVAFNLIELQDGFFAAVFIR